MIHFATALHCEANPVIHFYGMKPCGQLGKARFFKGETARLVVTGVGSIASAIGVTSLGERYAEPNALWLNLGICGHPSLSIGDALIASSIRSEAAKERFFPQFPIATPWRGQEVKTLASPSSQYQPGVAFDMESYGFYSAALAFTTVEYAHCVKIVSDNEAQPADAPLDKSLISDHIETHIQSIDAFAGQIIDTLGTTEFSESLAALQKRALSQFRFTETQRHQFTERLRKLNALEPETAFDPTLQAPDTKALLNALQVQIDRLASTQVC